MRTARADLEKSGRRQQLLEQEIVSLRKQATARPTSRRKTTDENAPTALGFTIDWVWLGVGVLVGLICGGGVMAGLASQRQAQEESYGHPDESLRATNYPLDAPEDDRPAG